MGKKDAKELKEYIIKLPWLPEKQTILKWQRPQRNEASCIVKAKAITRKDKDIAEQWK